MLKLWVVLFLFLTLPVLAQQAGTGISAGQVRIEASPAAVPSGGILVLKVGERFYPVMIDPATLLLRVGAAGLEIAAKSPVSAPPQLEITRTTAPLAALTLSATPQSGTLRVYWNGLQLTETDDYTVSGRVVTFVKQPEAGAIVRAEYR